MPKIAFSSSASVVVTEVGPVEPIDTSPALTRSAKVRMPVRFQNMQVDTSRAALISQLNFVASKLAPGISSKGSVAIHGPSRLTNVPSLGSAE